MTSVERVLEYSDLEQDAPRDLDSDQKYASPRRDACHLVLWIEVGATRIPFLFLPLSTHILCFEDTEWFSEVLFSHYIFAVPHFC
jgi:hypothetical protein